MLGQGSVLATAELPADAFSSSRPEDIADKTRLARPRWFSVAEVSRLHGFGFEPQLKRTHGDVAATTSASSRRAGTAVALSDAEMPVLGWPDGLKDKVKYQLLGNSMHVGVVKQVIMLLLGIVFEPS